VTVTPSRWCLRYGLQMVTWSDFTAEAPRIADVFARRHAAAGNLCMLATLRSDGYPRISPMEPGIFEDHLVLVGMPGTTKFRDLARDPRFCLHTATIDPHVSEGDAKLWGDVTHLPDTELHERFAMDLFERTGMDLRGQAFDPFYVADITGASSIAIDDDQLLITIWRLGEGEQIVRKT
jgi:nitroimidazol reductase NimA-like FMN-containing flavoprotein (pyridoxamine 5'-phosphate oxidase superfamily)